MPVTITIQGEHAHHAHRELLELAAVFNRATDTAAVVYQNLEAAASPVPEAEAPTEPEKKERKPRAKKAEPAPVVVPETPAKVKAQDEADEAAEAEVTQPKTEYTRDHVRAALGKYVQMFGAVAVETDAPALFKLVFPGQEVTRISEIPDTQEAFGKAIAGVEEMLVKNPFKRTAVGE